jgi:hypothetical protein
MRPDGRPIRLGKRMLDAEMFELAQGSPSAGCYRSQVT